MHRTNLGLRNAAIGLGLADGVRGVAVSLIQDLSNLSNETSSDRRRELLRNVADIFVANSGSYDQQKLGMFNDIFMMVAESVAVEARAELAERIADCTDAPVQVIERLASDELPVAAPVLSRSPVLSDEKIAAIAGSSSQDHLLAISGRAMLSEIITDVLVRRGDQRVVLSVAGNHGARFSQGGFGELARKAEGDQELQIRLVTRQDLPPETVEKMLPHLSETLVMKLAEAGYDTDGRLPVQILQKVRDKLGAALEQRDREGRQLAALIASVKAGQLVMSDVVKDLADEDRLHDLVSLLGDFSTLDAGLIGPIMCKQPDEPLALIARALEITWPAFEAVLKMRAKRFRTSYSPNPHLKREYEQLTPATAQRSLRFIKVSTHLSNEAA